MVRDTETRVSDQTGYLTKSQYTDVGPVGLNTDPKPPGVQQGSHQTVSFYVTGMTQSEFEPKANQTQGRLYYEIIKAVERNSTTAGKSRFFFCFFFFAFPSYISGVHHFWVRFLRM